MTKPRLLTISAVLAFLSLSLSAQSVRENVNAGIDNSASVVVSVVDSLTETPVSGAMVTLRNKFGERISSTNRFGSSYFDNIFGMKDSLDLRVHILGYKDVNERILLHSMSSEVTVRVVESRDTLAALVFRDDAILMVSKGDTIIYNASLIHTKEGDSLRELLNNLPGINVNGDMVSANGRLVNKILVNGNVLFGNALEPALNLIYGTDVKEIRVYDQHDQERLIAADTLGTKDHVLDVKTKRPLTEIANLEVLGRLGLFPDKTYDKSDRQIYALGGNVARYSKDKPRMEADFRGAKNTSAYILNSTPNTPVSSLSATAKYQARRSGNDSFYAGISLNGQSQLSASRRETEYLASSPLYGTSYSVDSENRNGNILGNLNLSYSRLVSESTSLSYRLSGSILNNSSTISEFTKYSVESMPSSIQDRSSSHSNFNYSLAANLELKTVTSKGQRKLEGGASLGSTSLAGNIIDTLIAAPHTWITADGSGKNRRAYINADASFKINRKIQFQLAGRAQYENLQKDYLAIDRIMNVTDETNTYKFLEKKCSAEAEAVLKYGVLSDNFHFNAGVLLFNENDDITDFLPLETDANHGLTRLYPKFETSFRYAGLQINASYSESGNLPAPELLRNRLDNSSAIYLNAGNPNLEAERKRTANLALNYYSFANAVTYGLTLSYDVNSDCIINDLIPFTEDTEVEGFNYQAKAGQILSRPVNGGISQSLRGTMMIDKAITSIKSRVTLSGITEWGKSPYRIAGREGHNNRATYSALLTYIGNYSDLLHLNLTYTPSLTVSGDSEYGSLKDFAQRISASASSRLFDLVDLGLSCSYVHNKSEAGLNYEYFKPNASIEFAFGKNKSKTIGIHFNDFLNKTVSEKFSVTEESLNRVYSRILSRSVILSFNLKFK